MTPNRRPKLTPPSGGTLKVVRTVAGSSAPSRSASRDAKRRRAGFGVRTLSAELSSCLSAQERCLNRQLSLPVSTMSQ